MTDHAGPRIGWPSIQMAERPLVSIVVSTYCRPRALDICVRSLLAQTYRPIEILVVHDGPEDEARSRGTTQLAVSRADAGTTVVYLETPKRADDWGNTPKEYGIREAHGVWGGYANDDNYYSPLYVEVLMANAERLDASFSYCNAVHSHRQWSLFDVQLELCQIDVSGWLARRDLILEAPWPIDKRDPVADGHHVLAVAREAVCVKSPGLLWVHN